MLSKSATMLLGLITHQPLNAYEIVKTLDYMNIKYWFNIGTSTVYATIKTLEKKQYLVGEIQIKLFIQSRNKEKQYFWRLCELLF